jgi:enoyl-CoA hydratase/carnithine racemase
MTTHAMIRYEASGGVARLTLDQVAKHNAMSFAMWSMLPDLVARAEADRDVRVVLVGGAGDKAFCAGADISQFGERRTDADAVAAYERAVSAALEALAGSSKPTVAAIRGICFGGGMALALCCDLRLAAMDVRFRIPAARLGLGYDFANVARLVHRLGPGAAAEMLFTAKIIDAAEGQRLGIAQRVYPVASFAADVAAYAATIAANAPLTLLAAKRALREIEQPEASRDRAAVGRLVAACFASADYAEGQAAFRDKREPRFTGE